MIFDHVFESIFNDAADGVFNDAVDNVVDDVRKYDFKDFAKGKAERAAATIAASTAAAYKTITKHTATTIRRL